MVAATQGKNPKKRWEGFMFLAGILFLSVGLFAVTLPATFRRVQLLEAIILKLVFVIIGAILILLALLLVFSARWQERRTNIKKAISSITLFFISLLASLVVLEIVLQVTSQEGCRVPDPVLHHSYRPHCRVHGASSEWNVQVQLNSLGLREEEIHRKVDDQVRILMLGDSFTIGWGVNNDQTFSALLERRLQEAGMNAEVINAGATSYSPILEYLYLREKGLELQPDIVILNFDMSDVQNDYFYLQAARYDEHGELFGISPSEEGNLLYQFYSKSRVVRLLEGPLLMFDSRYPPRRPWGEEHYGNIVYDKYLITREVPTAREREYFQVSLDYITKTAELCRKYNCTFILSTYPYGHQISENEWTTGRHNFGFQQGKIYSDRPERILQRFAEEQNISFVSMFDHFRKAAKTTTLFYRYDGHFTPAGHAVAAEALSSFVVSETMHGNEERPDSRTFGLPEIFKESYIYNGH